MPTDGEWVKKMSLVYSGALLSHKNEIMPFAPSRMDLQNIILSEIGQNEKRQIPYDVTYLQNPNYDTNELIYETDSQPQRTNLWLPKGREVGKGWIGSLGLADANYSILYTECINSKVLQYSTGNDTLYSVTNLTEQSMDKSVYRNVCIIESLCSQEKLTQHCKSSVVILQ